ncbi:MAG: biotin--[acetyl-CoA-carboxylase] ligase [Vicingaceae bacterium]
MNRSTLNFKIIQIDSGLSTNIYAQKLLRLENVQEGHVLQTDFQKDGKGQHEKKWDADIGKNLLFSIILQPNLTVEEQFLLSKSISVGLKNYFDSMSVGEVKVKWPNDILINGEKIAGILIENSIYKSRIKFSVVGIGLNVNQLYFDDYQRPATSLIKLSGKKFKLKETLEEVLAYINSAYSLMFSNPNELNKTYLQSLYGIGKPMEFEDKSGKFIGVILGVLPNGRLQLNYNGKLKDYDLKELKFLR